MIRTAALFLLTAPAAFAAAPHSGVTSTRTMPELSDIALFLCAAGALWFVRSRMRARFRKPPPSANAKD